MLDKFSVDLAELDSILGEITGNSPTTQVPKAAPKVPAQQPKTQPKAQPTASRVQPPSPAQPVAKAPTAIDEDEFPWGDESELPEDEEGDESLFAIPAPLDLPEIPSVPAQPDLPDFIDPSWLPEEDENAPKIQPGIFTLPDFQRIELPKRPKAKINIALVTPEDAKNFLAKQNDTRVKEALASFVKATAPNPIAKDKANLLGEAMGKLKGIMMDGPRVFGQDVKTGIQAANILINFLDSLIDKLPKDIRELVGKQLLKQVDPTKERPPQPLTSKYLKQWTTKDIAFIRRRERHIIQSTGVSRAEAETEANNEWDKITSLVDEYRPQGSENWSDQQRRNAINLFTEEVLTGRDIQETWDQIVKPFIDAGGYVYGQGQETSTEPSITKPDTSMYKRSELGDVAAALTELDRLQTDLSSLPEASRNELIPYFIDLGNIGNEFSNITENLSGHPKGEVSQALKDLAEEAAKTAKEIVVKIMAHKEWLEEEDVEFLFQEAWWVALSISEIAEEFRIKVEESKGLISWEDLKGSGFNIGGGESTARKVTDESKEGGPSRVRIRDPKTEDRARKAAIQRMIESGSYDEYLRSRRQYHANKSELEKNTSKELDRIRSYDYKMNKLIVNAWRTILASAYSPQKVREEFKKLQKIDELTALEVVKRCRESWLDEDVIDNLVLNTLKNRRLEHIKKSIREFESEGLIQIKNGNIVPRTANPTAVNLFIQYINEKKDKDELSFAKALQETEGLRFKKFKPGQTRREEGQRELKSLHRQKIVARQKIFEHLLKISTDPDLMYVHNLLRNAMIN